MQRERVRPAAVAVSTSEHVPGTPDHAHATEGFSFMEFLVKIALEEDIAVSKYSRLSEHSYGNGITLHTSGNRSNLVSH